MAIKVGINGYVLAALSLLLTLTRRSTVLVCRTFTVIFFHFSAGSPLLGRIGRIVLRNALRYSDIEVVAVNECVALVLFALKHPD